MKILVIGSGGREHAICWRLLQDRQRIELFCAPGNGGIGQVAKLVPIPPEENAKLVTWAKENKMEFAIIGPEAPLTKGLADQMKQIGIKVFGVGELTARLEASKIFTKDLMRQYHIPTARAECFFNYESAREYVDHVGAPLVIKADGLAAGKGVKVAHTKREAHEFLDQVMQKRIFGAAGEAVVIEEVLWGEEASFMVITDGETVIPLASSQDHKRLMDQDQGPNTGGMGAFSPTPAMTPKIQDQVMREIIYPILSALQHEEITYRGILYAGLMLTAKGPRVLEFNVRFGDPEAQVVLPRLKGNFLELLQATAEGSLNKVKVGWKENACACVVLASRGYPGIYDKGKVIQGLDRVAQMPAVMVFHAGTASQNGKWMSAGGRVLGVTALGEDMTTAVNRAYQAIEKIHFEGMHYRRDIGGKYQ